MTTALDISRRKFLVSSAAAAGGFALGFNIPFSGEALAQTSPEINAWVMVRPDDTIEAGPHGLSYPVYTAATAALALSHPRLKDQRREREYWQRVTRHRYAHGPCSVGGRRTGMRLGQGDHRISDAGSERRPQPCLGQLPDGW